MDEQTRTNIEWLDIKKLQKIMNRSFLKSSFKIHGEGQLFDVKNVCKKFKNQHN